METLRWNGLSATEQAELHSLVTSKKAGDGWVPDNDWLGFMILALPAAIAATIALGVVMGFGLSFQQFQEVWDLGFKEALTITIRRFLFLLPIVPAIWLVVFLFRNWGCRGYALTSFATVKVYGPKLQLIRHDEVASATRREFRSRKGSFTVLELIDQKGKTFTLYTHCAIADKIMATINRAQSGSATLAAA